jgi:anthranilate synthase component 2
MKVLIIDNYDSFTYNLFQIAAEALEESSSQLDVVRNDELTEEEIKRRNYDRIILSPGPGSPDDPAYFGVCAAVLTSIGQVVPILGVCLGMQGLAHYYGGKVVRAQIPMHGKVSPIEHDSRGVFADLPQGLSAMRYHSLVVEEASLPDCFELTARAVDGARELMGIRHKTLPLEGIQFHPESFATEGGIRMIENFLFRPERSGST